MKSNNRRLYNIAVKFLLFFIFSLTTDIIASEYHVKVVDTYGNACSGFPKNVLIDSKTIDGVDEIRLSLLFQDFYLEPLRKVSNIGVDEVVESSDVIKYCEVGFRIWTNDDNSIIEGYELVSSVSGSSQLGKNAEVKAWVDIAYDSPSGDRIVSTTIPRYEREKTWNTSSGDFGETFYLVLNDDVKVEPGVIERSDGSHLMYNRDLHVVVRVNGSISSLESDQDVHATLRILDSLSTLKIKKRKI